MYISYDIHKYIHIYTHKYHNRLATITKKNVDVDKWDLILLLSA